MDTNWIYYGIFFNDKTKALLFEKAKPYIPEGWKTYCHHMTIIFNDKSEEKNREAEALEICIGNHESLMVTGVGISDRAVAFSVDYETQNSVSHITIATAPGAKPVESNNITNWKPIEPFYVTGIVDKFTKNGNTMKITESELKTIVAESVRRILSEGDIYDKMNELARLDRYELFSRLLEELGKRKMNGKTIVINKDNVFCYDDFLIFSGDRTSQKITFRRMGDLWVLDFDGDEPMLLENCPEDFFATLLLNLDNIVTEGLIHPTEYGNDVAFNAETPSQVFKLNNWTYTTESKDNGVLMLRCYTDNNNSFEMGNFPEFEKVVDDLNKFYKYHGSKTVAEAIPDDGVSRGRLLKVYKRA